MVNVDSINIGGFQAEEVCVNKTYCFPRIVWCYWEQNNIPLDVRKMIRVTRKSLQNFTVGFVSQKNIKKFLNINNFPEHYYDFKRKGSPNKADYIRMSLLEKFGGIYVDAGTIVNSGQEMEWFIHQAIEHQPQLVAFKYGFEDHDIHFGFLGAPRNSFYLKSFIKEYNNAFSVERHVYCNATCKFLLEQGVNLFFRCLPKPKSYFMMDTIFTKVNFLNSTLNESILRLPQERGPNRLFIECQYKKSCFIQRYIHDPVVQTFPFVKVFGHFRIAIANRIEREEKLKKKKNEGNVKEKKVKNEKTEIKKTMKREKNR